MAKELGGTDSGRQKQQEDGTEQANESRPAFEEVTSLDEVAERLATATANGWPIGDGAGGTMTARQAGERIGELLYSAYANQEQSGKPATSEQLARLADTLGIPQGGGLREAVVRLASALTGDQLKAESRRPEFTGPSVTRRPEPGREQLDHLVLAPEDNPAAEVGTNSGA